MQYARSEKMFCATAALITWFAIIMQLVLIIQNRVTGLPETLIRFFSFFTILTNILVAVYFTLFSLGKAQRGFWSPPSTATAIAVYILVVGIVYNIVLRQLWAPVGMQKIVDELLHLLVPLLFLGYWIFFVSPQAFSWKNALTWLAYPFLYLVFVLIRGSFSNYYPYPFLDVYNHGWEKVMFASAAILVLFLLLSCAFIAASRFLAGRKVSV